MGSNEHPVWRSHCLEAKRGEMGGQRMPWHGEAMGSLPGGEKRRDGWAAHAVAW
jgi:hypothetical protein